MRTLSLNTMKNVKNSNALPLHTLTLLIDVRCSATKSLLMEF